MIYVVNINNKEYEVEVERGQANLIKTTDVIAPVILSNSVPVNTQPAILATVVNAPVASVSIGAGEPICSPMPGTILGIRVEVGSKVKKGQIVIILEAMKMENEIFAPADGTITEISVTKGASVATNDVLLRIQ
ncbi:MAG: biotin/lipoyl-containing protein [Mobilitalea sp.]